jgi:hypothetical protein
MYFFLQGQYKRNSWNSFCRLRGYLRREKCMRQPFWLPRSRSVGLRAASITFEWLLHFPILVPQSTRLQITLNLARRAAALPNPSSVKYSSSNHSEPREARSQVPDCPVLPTQQADQKGDAREAAGLMHEATRASGGG